MTYSVSFLKDGAVIDTFVLTAADYLEFKMELARVRDEFRARHPGLKEIMSVIAMPGERLRRVKG